MPSNDSASVRIIRCPACGITVHAEMEQPLPDKGPVCAMGHEPTLMQTAVTR